MQQTNQTNPIIKINDIDPKHQNFNLYFQICEIIAKAKGILICRIVDDTGIIDACFDRYIDKLDKGSVYLMTNLQCGLIDGHPRVQMKSNTVVSKQADIIGFKDKSNDVSKRVFQISKQKPNIQIKQQKNNVNKTVTNATNKIQQNKTINTKQNILSSDSNKKQETLIPFSKQQAKQQLKMIQKLEQIRLQNKKQFQDPTHKQKNIQYKEKHQNNKNIQFKEKQKQKQKQKQKHVKYEQKFENKKGYKVKQQQKNGQQMRNKAKSTLYQQKPHSRNGYREINNDNFKNNGNKNKFYDDDYSNKKYSKFENRQQRKHSYEDNKSKPHPKHQKQSKQIKKKQEQNKNNVQSSHKKVQQPKHRQRKQSKGQVTIINLLNQVGNCVNLKVRITQKIKPIQNSAQKQILVADSTGSTWLRINKLHLESKQFYEIDNLEVCKDQSRLFLKQSEFSQARRFQGTFSFNLRQINIKQ